MTAIENIDLKGIHDGKIVWSIKDDAKKLYDDLRIHANGEVPTKLISTRRPNEPDIIKQYRFDIYAPKTEHPISKVMTSLTKTRRSPDYKVDYSKTESPTFIKETLKDYLEENFPFYDSIDSWLFDEAMQNLLIDANAVCLIIPLKYEVDETELIQPIPYIVNVDEVLYFSENDYAVVKTDRKHIVITEKTKSEYDIYILSTRNEIVEYWLNEKKEYNELNRYTHNLNELQAFRFRGSFYKNINGDVVWKSILSPMVVHLNEAARIYSDKQAEYVLHMHSEKWTINTNTCKKCYGTGQLKIGLSNTLSVCPSCNGTRHEKVTPFENHVVNIDLNKPNQQIPPIPPTGYVQKSIEIAKLLDEDIKSNLYQALESVNMQFLYNVPSIESGIAKQWDRDETDNFAHRNASLLKYIRENVAYYVCNLRYYYLVPSVEDREKMLPIISIPQKYDLVNNALLIEEYKQAKDAKINPILLGAMELEIATKRFSTESVITDYTKMTYFLDPFYGVTEDEKLMRLQNKGISDIDYIISSNIYKLVKKAIIDNDKFTTLEYDEQLEILKKYAEDIKKGNSITNELLVGND